MAHRAYAQGRSRVHRTQRRGSSPGQAVVWLSAITALGGLLFGYDTGVVSGALLFLKNDFPNISSVQKELVTSFLLTGAAMGAIGAGRVAEPYRPAAHNTDHRDAVYDRCPGGRVLACFRFLLAAQVVIGPGVRVGLHGGADVYRGSRPAAIPRRPERDHRRGHVLHVRLPHRAGAHLLLAAGTGDQGPAAGRRLGGPRPAGGRHAIMEGGRQRTALAGSSRALAGRARHGRGCRNAGPGP